VFRTARSFAVASLLTLVACGGGAGGLGAEGTLPPDPPPPSPAEIDAALAVFDLVNDERAAAGLAPVVWDDAAADAAYAHAFDMDDRGYFSHVNPNGESPGDRMLRAGAFWTSWAENIAQGQSDPVAVLDAWMNSSGHRENLLGPYRRLGVGVRMGPGGPWWVQDFAGP
jgi:uncharacterized protein YkwD